MTDLHIPDVTGLDTLEAAMAYAQAGLYVGPLENGSKHPGSRLGKNWQQQTSRDPQRIASWFAGSSDGVFLHCGRSGLIVFDVDRPHNLDGVLLIAIRDCQPPIQSTRDNQPGRGHYIFAQPAGRQLGNGLGRLPSGWGEIRGLNGVIVAAPTEHEMPHGQYLWTRTGAIPTLPVAVADLLGDATPGADAATDSQIRAFLDRHTAESRPRLIDAWSSVYAQHVAAGDSRHDRMVSVLTGAMSEARAGYFPAKTAMDRLEAEFFAAVSVDGHGQQGKKRTAGQARAEWADICAWAVSQAEAADLNAVHARVAEHIPDGDDLSWIPGADKVLEAAGSPFTDKGKLLVDVLAEQIRALGPIARGRDDITWSYTDGVWRPDKNVIRRRTAELLQGRFASGHVKNVSDYMIDSLPVIDCAPVEAFVNLRNGMYNWRTGQLHEHDPSLMSTVQLAVDYDPDATCPGFDTFLEQVLPADAVDLAWEVVAYLIYNGNPLHRAIMLIGEGSNGKSVFLHVIERLLGSENVAHVTLHALADSMQRFAATDLFGRVANIAGDIDARHLPNTGRFKELTGGDPIRAEYKGRDAFDFVNWSTSIFSANELPSASDATEGFLRRWLPIEFPNSFAGREDRNLAARLESEAAGIAVKALTYLPKLIERGEFTATVSLMETKAKFARAVDPVREWLYECTEEVTDGWCYRTDLYQAYRSWAEAGGRLPLADRKFYAGLRRAGHAELKVHGHWGFVGFDVVDGGQSVRGRGWALGWGAEA